MSVHFFHYCGFKSSIPAKGITPHKRQLLRVKALALSPTASAVDGLCDSLTDLHLKFLQGKTYFSLVSKRVVENFFSLFIEAAVLQMRTHYIQVTHFGP